jgi:hypothetical protein
MLGTHKNEKLDMIKLFKDNTEEFYKENNRLLEKINESSNRNSILENELIGHKNTNEETIRNLENELETLKRESSLKNKMGDGTIKNNMILIVKTKENENKQLEKIKHLEQVQNQQ